MDRSALAKRVGVGLLALSAAGGAFLATKEGTVQRTYLDSIGVPTVCTGHTGKEVKLGQYFTLEECAAILRVDVGSASYAIKQAIKVPLYQYEFDALVSFCFNVGNANCTSSTMFKLINQGKYEQAGQEFTRWRFAGGKDCYVRANNCYGVYTRRLDEANVWKGMY